MHDQVFDDSCSAAYEPSSGDLTDGYADQPDDHSLTCYASAVAE